MTEQAILVICHEPDLAGSLGRSLERSGEIRVSAVASVDEAISRRGLDEFALVLIYLGSQSDAGQVDALLWTCSRAGRALPLVVVSDRYSEAEGLAYFQRGVTDYLSLHDHGEVLAKVVSGLILPRSGGMERDGKLRPARPSNAAFNQVVSRRS